MAYVGNKGTHTLGDTDQNNTDPNESALFLPGQYSRNGQTLHWDPSAPGISATSDGIAADGGVSNARLLKRYYAHGLPACSDPNYISLANLQAVDGDPNLTAGQCGWTSDIAYYGDDQNTEFDALQVTLAKTMSKGLAITANYQWASAFADANGYWTWSHVVTHYRDSNVRTQQLVVYGSYESAFRQRKAVWGRRQPCSGLSDWRIPTERRGELVGRLAVRRRLQQLRGQPGLQPQHRRIGGAVPSQRQWPPEDPPERL